MIIGKKKLRHSAAGLLGKFISRNNSIERLWAPGVLYTEAQGAGNCVELDLLAEVATPDLPQAMSIARTFAAYLRMALARHGFKPDVLSSANVSLVFGLPPPPRQPGDNSFGDGFNCTVTLTARDGKTVSYGASALCAAHASQVFKSQMALREGAFKLFQGVVQRNLDTDGRWSLEVLQEQGFVHERLEFDLLHERGTPSGPVTDAVARSYARLLRQLLGEWMSELGAATVAVRFFSSPRNPQGSVFVETALVTLDQRSHWFNGGGPVTSAPPWEQAPP
jgi:hypothetical protein